MNARRHGYSLFELMIVLLVLGVLAGVAAPRYAAVISWQRAEAAALRVAADLRMARDEAVLVSSPIAINFFPDENRYAVPGLADIDRADRTYEQRLGDAENAVDLSAVDFDGAASVRFDIYGRPDAAGKITIRHGGEQREVVLSETGRITVQ